MNFGGGFNSNSQPAFNAPQSSGPFGASSAFGGTPHPTSFNASTGWLFTSPTPNAAGGGVYGTVSQMTVGGGSPDGSQGTFGRAAERTVENPNMPSHVPKSYLHSISAMKDFEHCQPEMLRAVDYKRGHRRASGQIKTPPLITGSSTVGGSQPRFGYTAPSFGPFGSAGTGFGPQQSPSVGLGSTFGQSSGSMFDGGAPFGPRPSHAAMLSHQQSGSSMFGNQPSWFSTAPGTGLLGQSSGAAPFVQGGMSGSGFSGQQSSGPAFGIQSTPAFTLGSTSGGPFGKASTGSPLFSQPFSSSSSIFSQSSPFPTAPQPQGPQPGSLFGVQTSQSSTPWSFPQQALPPPQPTFPHMSSVQIPLPAAPAAPSSTFSFASHLTPGVVEILQGVPPVSREKQDELNTQLHCIPVTASMERPHSSQKLEPGASSGWECFALSKRTEASLENEIKEAIEAYERTRAQGQETSHRPKEPN